MAVRTVNVGNFNFGDTLTDSQVDALPGGWIGYQEKLTPTSGVTTTETTIVTVTVTLNAGRLVMITGYVPTWTSDAGDRAQFRLLEGASQLQLCRSTTQNTAVATEPPTVLQRVQAAPTVGSHTYSMTVVRNLGTGSVAVAGDPTTPAFIVVQDLGSYPT